MSVKFTLDRREFDRTLRQYGIYSSRDIPTIVNTKAFYIARRALRETPAVKVSEVRKKLRDIVVASGKGKGVKLKMSEKHPNAPIAALIVNKRQGKRGKPGFYGEAMAAAIDSLISHRIRGVAFLKSGWLWAIKKLEPFAEKSGAPRIPSSVKTYGKAKGSATPAKPGWKAIALIINTVTAKWDKRELAASKAEPALQRAIDAETQSMKDYVERKLNASARRASIKTR